MARGTFLFGFFVSAATIAVISVPFTSRIRRMMEREAMQHTMYEKLRPSGVIQGDEQRRPYVPRLKESREEAQELAHGACYACELDERAYRL